MKRSADTIATTAGPAEVEVRGSGVPVLVLHGSPGGIDQARAMSQFLTKNRSQVICVSRPGYLGTPLNLADPSIDHEADLLAAVLDAVGVERAGVLAYSGGGPSAYRLAVRHPDRVSAIVAIAAVSSRYVAPTPTATDRFMFGTRTGQWLIGLLAQLAPGQLIESALASEGSVRGEELKTAAAGAMADPEQRAAVLALSITTGWRGSRKAGWDNDVANYDAIDSLELDHVRCPVLLIHGDADTDATVDYSYTAHSALPDSTLVVMERGTHLAFYAHPEARDVQEQARKWFTSHT
jgi:pimeloyl-ACP methyl ester carboxylesterase